MWGWCAMIMGQAARDDWSDSMHNQLKPIPVFASEAEERAFWETHDSTDYVDWDNAQLVVFPNLRMSLERGTAAAPAVEAADGEQPA